MRRELRDSFETLVAARKDEECGRQLESIKGLIPLVSEVEVITLSSQRKSLPMADTSFTLLIPQLAQTPPGRSSHGSLPDAIAEEHSIHFISDLVEQPDNPAKVTPVLHVKEYPVLLCGAWIYFRSALPIFQKVMNTLEQVIHILMELSPLL